MNQEPFLEFVGIYDGDGNRYEPDSIPKPALCALCREDGTPQPFDRLLCTLARLEHLLDGERGEFTCHSFASRD